MQSLVVIRQALWKLGYKAKNRSLEDGYTIMLSSENVTQFVDEGQLMYIGLETEFVDVHGHGHPMKGSALRSYSVGVAQRANVTETEIVPLTIQSSGRYVNQEAIMMTVIHVILLDEFVDSWKWRKAFSSYPLQLRSNNPRIAQTTSGR